MHEDAAYNIVNASLALHVQTHGKMHVGRARSLVYSFCFHAARERKQSMPPEPKWKFRVRVRSRKVRARLSISGVETGVEVARKSGSQGRRVNSLRLLRFW